MNLHTGFAGYVWTGTKRGKMDLAARAGRNFTRSTKWEKQVKF